MSSKIEEARYTCDGLHRLIRRLNGAAVDLDKGSSGGESTYEILALLASTNDCINNLSAQLDSIKNESNNDHALKQSNIADLNSARQSASQKPQTENLNLLEAKAVNRG